MNYSDEYIFDLCKIQANIFEACVDTNLNANDYVLKYMKSSYAQSMDNGLYYSEHFDSVYIINDLKTRVKKIKRNIYQKDFLHWAGYQYRYYANKYRTASILLIKQLPLKYLNSVYPLYHSLDIDKSSELLHEYFVSCDTKLC